MSKDIIQQIEHQIPELTSAQRKVAEYILNGPIEAALSTINQIAYAAGVSTTSVIRLANALGYTAFSDFQKALKEYLHAYAAPVNKFSLHTRDAMSETNDQRLAADVYQNTLENLNSARAGTNDDTVNAVVDLLSHAEHIYVCGARTSECIARYLSYNFNRMFLNTTYHDDASLAIQNVLKRITEKDVLVAITLSRYNKSICQTAKRCKERGASVIAMTDSYDSPLVPFSDYQLIGKCASNDFHNSIVAQIFLCDILIGACSQHNQQRVHENLEKEEKIIAEIQHYIRK